MVRTYESDPAFVAKVKGKADGRRATAALAMADTYKSAGNAERAKAKYQEVIDPFPNTPYADTARQGLASLASN